MICSRCGGIQEVGARFRLEEDAVDELMRSGSESPLVALAHRKRSRDLILAREVPREKHVNVELMPCGLFRRSHLIQHAQGNKLRDPAVLPASVPDMPPLPSH